MQSGSDSFDSRYDSSDSRGDSRYDSAAPPPRKGGRLTVALTYIGLSMNMLVLLAGALAVPNVGLLNIVLLPALGLLIITALTVNALTFAFGRLAARSEMPADGKAACRVCVVVALLQVLTVLAIIVLGGLQWWGRIFPAPMVTKPTSAVPATYQSPTVLDERPTMQSRPTVREKGQ